MSFGTGELVLLLALGALIFGTRKLRNVGGDLGSAVKGFRKALSEEPEEEKQDVPAGDAKASQAAPRDDGKDKAP